MCVQVFKENDVDLDIIRDLSTGDLADMGITSKDMQTIVEAARRLPPGSLRSVLPDYACL